MQPCLVLANPLHCAFYVLKKPRRGKWSISVQNPPPAQHYTHG